MNKTLEPVDNLKKVKAAIQTEVLGTASLNHFQPVEIEFITGVSSDGFTPFEYRLINKNEGDVIQFSLKPNEIHETFRHHVHSLPFHLHSESSEVSFTVKILEVQPATDREIIKAMAEMAACEGCCGDH